VFCATTNDAPVETGAIAKLIMGRLMTPARVEVFSLVGGAAPITQASHGPSGDKRHDQRTRQYLE
jgi:hypothetical protein